jgi:hypothetical protein
MLEVQGRSFQVTTFNGSRYGLLDSDDDEEYIVVPEVNRKNFEPMRPPVPSSNHVARVEDESAIADSFIHIKNKRGVFSLNAALSGDSIQEVKMESEQLLDESQVLMEEIGSQESKDDDVSELSECAIEVGVTDTPKAESHFQASKPNIERMQLARNVQTLKSLIGAMQSPAMVAISGDTVKKGFSYRPEEIISKKIETKRNADAIVPAGPFRLSRNTFSPERAIDIPSPLEPSPQKYVKQSKVVINQRVSWEKSVVRGKELNTEDGALFMGRSFRIGWGPDNSYTVTGSGTLLNALSPVAIRKVSCFGTVADVNQRTSFAIQPRNPSMTPSFRTC